MKRKEREVDLVLEVFVAERKIGPSTGCQQHAVSPC